MKSTNTWSGQRYRLKPGQFTALVVQQFQHLAFQKHTGRARKHVIKPGLVVVVRTGHARAGHGVEQQVGAGDCVFPHKPVTATEAIYLTVVPEDYMGFTLLTLWYRDLIAVQGHQLPVSVRQWCGGNSAASA